jgi:hypothetical protein
MGAEVYTQGFGSKPLGVETPIIAQRNPTPNDVNYPLGQEWVNSVNATAYLLTQVSTISGVYQASWQSITGAASSLNTLTGNTGGPISPTFGDIQIVGTGSVAVAGSGSTLTISASTTSLTWNNDAPSGILAINNGYVVTASTPSPSFTLPVTAPIGSVIEILVNGGTSWTINLSGQTIKAVTAGPSIVTYSTSISNAIVGGSPSIRLVCAVANTGWNVETLTGAILGS